MILQTHDGEIYSSPNQTPGDSPAITDEEEGAYARQSWLYRGRAEAEQKSRTAHGCSRYSRAICWSPWAFRNHKALKNALLSASDRRCLRERLDGHLRILCQMGRDVWIVLKFDCAGRRLLCLHASNAMACRPFL